MPHRYEGVLICAFTICMWVIAVSLGAGLAVALGEEMEMIVVLLSIGLGGAILIGLMGLVHSYRRPADSYIDESVKKDQAEL